MGRRKILISLAILCLLILPAFVQVKAGAGTVNGPDLKSAAVSKKGAVKLRWKNAVLASGYIVYRSEKKKSGFKRIKTIHSGTTLSYTDTTAAAAGTYYYRVRAFVDIAGYRYYSGNSRVRSVEIKCKEKKVSQEEFGKALAGLQKQTGPMGEICKDSADPFASCRLLLKGKTGSLSFQKYHPTVVIQGPDHQYILQFKNADAAKKAYGRIRKRKDIKYVEPDDYVTGAGE